MSDPRPHPHPHPRPHRHHGAWSPLAWALAPAKAWAQRGWQVLLATVMLLVLAVSPSVNTPAHRSAVARQVMRATWPHVLWFSLVATLLGVVLIRIVVVTAQSYGLSQYALEMVVRVLVLELLPLLAALFVALRWSLPATAELARALRKAATASAAGSAASTATATATAINANAQASDGTSRASAAADPTSIQTHTHAPATTQAQAQVAWLAGQALPRALAGVFAVWLLAAVSGVLGLVMAYLLVYGWTPWGLDAYTHMVGRVFSPAVALIFALKTWAFSLAVAVVPLAGLAAPVVWHNPHALRAMEVQGLVRMTAVLLLVEVVSLMGNYY